MAGDGVKGIRLDGRVFLGRLNSEAARRPCANDERMGWVADVSD